MSKKWMYIAGAVALVIVVVGVVLLLKPGQTPTPGNVTAGAGATSTASGSTTSGAGQSNGTTLTSTTTTIGGGGGLSTGHTLKPFAQIPNPNIPARPADVPVAAGKKLAPLTTAPSNTVSGLKLGSAPVGAEFNVTMQPYGIGPSTLFGSRLAIRVDAISPVAKFAPPKSFVNGNLLVLANTNDGGLITTGGKYTALLTLMSDGIKLIPVLSKATPTK